MIFCKQCCMDGSASELMLDNNGVCNFCHQAQKALKEIEIEKVNLPQIVEQIKKDGAIIGLSGGVDSSMALHHCVRLGIKPLVFSLDNGYNNSVADENIMRLVETLEVPFYRYVIDLNKYGELQSAFLKSGVKNIEAITDHILFAATYEMAIKHNVKWIISGGNTTTESIMPASWGEDPRDLYWIKSIYKQFTGKRLTGLPTISLLKEQYYRLIKGIKLVRILDYCDYNREEAIKLLEKEYGYKSYGEKHCENYFTWWFQSYYLFEKFGIDKRKAHYASLINSGQMTRKEAMDLLADRPEYPQLGIENIIHKYPRKSYQDYPNSWWVRKIVIKLYGVKKRFSNIFA